MAGRYWDQRFKAEGRIWGDAPSVTATMAEKAFKAGGVQNVLVPGAGYGRHTDFFADCGYTVTAVEVSAEALALARRRADVSYHLGSVLDLPSGAGGHDAVYCFNVLHLFRAPDRAHFIEKTREVLRDGGLAFFAVFSEEEPQFGRGQEVEPRTFESKPGRPVHFFTDQDLRATFRGFDVVDTGLIDDPEDHGEEGPHTHRLRWILARKAATHEFDGEKYKSASRHQKEWGRRLIDSLGLLGDEHVLDLGCGDGVLTAEIARRVPAGSVLGVDASQGMISVARALEGENLSFEMRRIEEIDFRGELDLIFSNAALHWVKDHRGLLARCGGALKPGGRLRFNFAGDGNCLNLFAVVRRLMSEPRFERQFACFEWPWRMPSVGEYRALLVESGAFSEIRVEGQNADRTMTREEMVRWLDQPSLVPFREILPAEDGQAFRDAVVAEMLERTRRGEGQHFETFRRIDVSATKASAAPIGTLAAPALEPEPLDAA